MDKLKEDNNIICIILAGSLYNKSITKNSDINLIVIVSDEKIQDISYTCMEDELVFNIDVFSRTEFIQNISVQRGDILYHISVINKWLEKEDSTRHVQFQFSKIVEKLAQIEYCLNENKNFRSEIRYCW